MAADLLQTLKTEWGVISIAPWSFLAAIIAVGSVLAIVLQLWHAREKRHLKTVIETKDATIEQLSASAKRTEADLSDMRERVRQLEGQVAGDSGASADTVRQIQASVATIKQLTNRLLDRQHLVIQVFKPEG
jgi:peptidoglycan hydrolase CwlO-like protein